MAKLFNLYFNGTKFRVPKGNLIDLFEHQRDLFDATSYKVQSSVPVEVFEEFVKALETGGKVRVTKENAGSISILAQEFWLEDLLAECFALEGPSVLELITYLSERISKLEGQMSSQRLAIIAELKESIADHERQLKSLDCRISGLEATLMKTPTDLKELKPSSRGPVSRSNSPKKVELPLKEAKSLGGIISYLTQTHGGNVHDKGIVTIPCKSVGDSSRYAARNVADLTSGSALMSKNERGQWIRWDFHEMRIRPTHYTINGGVKSWLVEGSLDLVNWTEIDRKTNITDLKELPCTASFAVSNSAECRFIRLTQTGENLYGRDDLQIRAFEVFWTLIE
jgi:uncharacterized coiled-coil protein SlyX